MCQRRRKNSSSKKEKKEGALKKNILIERWCFLPIILLWHISNTRRRRSRWQHYSPESGSYRPVSTFHMWLEKKEPNMLRRRRRCPSLRRSWLSLSSDFFSPPQKPRKLKAAARLKVWCSSTLFWIVVTFFAATSIFCWGLEGSGLDVMAPQ